MTVQINTDNNVEGNARLKAYISEELGTALARFEDKITRLEVHLGDENSDKSGTNDKRCLIEARPVNMQPVAVTNFADTTEKAFQGALDKIKKVLETTFEKKKTY
ncbi:Sigma 54 modulation protein / S30EA ribosomal protein [Flavobacterium segetis]|uniref:Sigma 54 modulation protein / S30EA ribosomal protein n=1 Tax=Flavobacterium segetis TaxID=271157 RepID=A0A1M5FCL7_9FLAO|nr:HPF/RaiA family ribosome-associated protein [Flavobacterium segetis]SHF89285.1 Sigma 54 modulation protein / S30EA ribosomal protein [Flavobacterium segetis]